MIQWIDNLKYAEVQMAEEPKSEKELREEIINALYEEYPIDEMVKFSELDLQEKLKVNSFWIVRFRDLYNRALSEYEHLEDLYEKLIGERYDWYRFESEKELDKYEIKNYYLPKDKKIIKMKKILARQKIKVDFFKMCLQGMEQQGWRMKSFIDAEKGGI